MSKRAFLIHGWDSYPEEGWRPWLRDKLKKKGFQVHVPAMPNTSHPKLEEWKSHLIKNVGTPDKDCYFVGHSLGCITILRYLESLKPGQQVGGVILVAGFTSHLGYEEIERFFKNPINWEKVKTHCKKFVYIYSDNDPYVSTHYSEFFKEKLKAKIILKQDMRHFSGNDGINELPVVLEEILRISK